MNTVSDHNLWAFACEVYSQSGVADACIHLQDHYGLDVPLLLFCCWYGRYYGELSPLQIQQALSFSKGWSANTTQPLRAIRRNMKSSYGQQWPLAEGEWLSLREQVKSAELESERLLLQGLSQLASDEAAYENMANQCKTNQYKANQYKANQYKTKAAMVNIKQCFDIIFDLKNNGNAVEFLLEIFKAVFEGEDSDTLHKTLLAFI